MADLPEDILPKLEQLLEQQGTGEEQLLFKLFELHIYTHGDQDYAAEMAKLLDPTKTFFGGRVISAVSMGGFKTLAALLQCLITPSCHSSYQCSLPSSAHCIWWY